MKCTVCGTAMRPDVLEGTYRCFACGFYSSVFPVKINEEGRIDESMRERALKPVRLSNFQRILDQCAPLLPPSARLLDVGCAHGWFLEASKNKGYRSIGIEPDETMASLARSSGFDVISRSFPDAVPFGSTYDAITFNDVFEHLQDVPSALRALRDHLEDKGIVMLNIPVSDGLIFRIARLAARVGWKGPLSRLWQHGLPSPHLSYFSARTLSRLMQEHGFACVKSGSLESIPTQGLFERIRYDRNISSLYALVIYLAAHAIKPIADLFPSDIQYFIFQKHP